MCVSLCLLLITIHINASLILSLGGVFVCFFLTTSTASFSTLVHTVHIQRKLKWKRIIKATFKNKTITLQLVPANCIVMWLLSFTEGITCQNWFLFFYRSIFTSCTVIFLKSLCPHLSELLQSTCLFFATAPFTMAQPFPAMVSELPQKDLLRPHPQAVQCYRNGGRQEGLQTWNTHGICSWSFSLEHLYWDPTVPNQQDHSFQFGFIQRQLSFLVPSSFHKSNQVQSVRTSSGLISKVPSLSKLKQLNH